MKVVIYNDTENGFGRTHFGTQLVANAWRQLLPEYGMNLIGTVPLDDCIAREVDHDLLAQADLVIVNGEGSLHHGRRQDLVRIGELYPAALVNTVYDSNPPARAYLKAFRYIAARESCSRDALAAEGVEVDLVPDVALASRLLDTYSEKHWGRTQVLVDHFDGVVTLQDFSIVLPAIAGAKSVATGSFHAALVAMAYGKKVTLWGSNSHKMEGLAQDAGLVIHPSKELALAAEPMQFQTSLYLMEAAGAIEAMMEKLAGLG
jgi:hypothetical protein